LLVCAAESVAWAATGFADESVAGVAGGVTTAGAMVSAATGLGVEDAESAERGFARAARAGAATCFGAGVSSEAVVS
jgi:hypothetical protein